MGGVLGPSAKEHPVAGQGFGVGVILGARQFVQLRDLAFILPGMQVWLG